MGRRGRAGPALTTTQLRGLGIENGGRGSQRNRRGGHHHRRPETDRRSNHSRPARDHGSENRRSQARSKPPAGEPQLRIINPELEDDDFEGFGSSDDEEEDDEDDEPAAKEPRVSRATQDRLAKDDAEIADLERKLGLKKKKSLPKAFEDDGLGELLEDLDDAGGSDGDGGEVRQKSKRKAEADEWLAQKRRKAIHASKVASKVADSNDDGMSDLDDLAESDVDEEDEDDEDDAMDGLGSDDEDMDDVDDLDDMDDMDSELDEETPRQPPKRIRENPYVAPSTGTEAPAKYIPPSQRQAPSTDQEKVTVIRRRTQGLINRLTEANMVSLLSDFEKLYREYPRQHVTDAIVDLLLTQIIEPTALPDTLLILIAGFSTAMHRIMGTDFGANIVQRAVLEFRKFHAQASRSVTTETSFSSKETSNLISFLTQLYSFKMLSCKMSIDFIKLLLGDLSELNAELLLRIVRLAGQQLRRDDPSALKDVVLLIRPAVAKIGEQNLSIRTKFMIDTINDLKNNKMKTGIGASAVNAELTTRMRKTLGTLNARKLKTTEALGIGLDDIDQSSKKGKWWLVGASWAGRGEEDGAPSATKSSGDQPESKRRSIKDVDVLGSWADDLPDVTALEDAARQQGMNTNVRRAIFVSLLGAADDADGYTRYQRLRLNKFDKREIADVLCHCVGAEEAYNEYYTLVARRACSDKRIQWAFKDCFWKLFGRMGESLFEGPEEDAEAEDDDTLDVRRVENMARMLGEMMGMGCLGLDVIKPLDLAHLHAKTKVFVETALVTLLTFKGRDEDGQKGGKPDLGRMFARVDPGQARLLRFFLRKYVRKSKRVEKEDAKRLAKSLSVVQEALEVAEAGDSAAG